jgi:phosphocarrier protein
VTLGNRQEEESIMVAREVTILSKTGLESKMAARLIQKASGYESNIWIQKQERKANAKSLLGLLSLGISPGDKITIITDGRDEETALNDLEAFANTGMTD